MALGLTQPDRNEYQEYFLGARSSRCPEQTALPPSCFDIPEIWETQPSGNFRTLPGLYRDYFNPAYIKHKIQCIGNRWQQQLI
jgi:hypothetical protein